MARSLIQLGITDRETLAAARRRAGGEGVLARSIAEGVGGLMPSVPPIVLSTCERFEVYALCRRDDVGAVAGAIGHHIGNSVGLERRVGEAAVAHLFSVASGLDSRLIGEPHILGQVSRAAAGFEGWEAQRRQRNWGACSRMQLRVAGEHARHRAWTSSRFRALTWRSTGLERC